MPGKVAKLSLVVVVLLLFSVVHLCVAFDLQRVERSIVKEPRYQSKQPGYLLMVFGKEAAMCVWLVVDDDIAYLDRNANKDLTEPGEGLRVSEIRETTSSDAIFKEERVFRLGDVVPKSGDRSYEALTLRQFRRPTEKFPVNTPEHIEAKQFHSKYPNLAGTVMVLVDGEFRQNASPPLGRTPSEAPLVHIDGPLEIHINELLGTPVLRRSGEETEVHLRVSLGTSGLGKYSFAYYDYSIAPEDIYPTVVARFKNKDEGKPEVVSEFLLKERC
jgi:hypothetical protein